MRLLIVVHASLYDASLPLIKALSKQVDLTCLYEVYPNSPNMMGITVSDFKDKNIISGEQIDCLQKYSDYLPLKNVWLIRFYRPSQIREYISFMITERRALESFRPDFVYFYNVPYAALLFTLFSNIPWATAVHDPILHSGEKNALFYKIMRSVLFKKCNDFFLFSESLKKQFSNYYNIDVNKIHQTYLGSYNQLNRHFKEKKKSSKLRLLFFGRIESYKGLRFLLKAYKMLLEEGYSDISLKIAGRGRIETDIVDLNRDVHVINRFYSEDEFEEMMADCDLVVCPYTDATQSGVIMSSYAFRKPCLVTNVGGLPEMVSHMYNGYIIPPSDVISLHDALLYINQNRSILEEWSTNIDKDYCDCGKYGWDSISNELLTNINNIISK